MSIKNKTLILILFIVIFNFTQVSSGFIPKDENIFITTVSNQGRSVVTGDNIDISVIIKNLSNNSISNITLYHSLPSDVQFINTPLGKFTEPSNYSASDKVSIENIITGTNITLGSFNMTNNNMTINFQGLNAYEALGYKFTVNISREGLVSFNKFKMGYYDHFGDFHSKLSQVKLEYQVSPKEVNEKEGYFPKVSVADNNLKLIIIGSIAVILVAILSKVLYLKKPIEFN